MQICYYCKKRNSAALRQYCASSLRTILFVLWTTLLVVPEDDDCHGVHEALKSASLKTSGTQRGNLTQKPRVKKIFLEHILRPIQKPISSLPHHFGIGVKITSKNIFLPLVSTLSCSGFWVLVFLCACCIAWLCAGVQKGQDPELGRPPPYTAREKHRNSTEQFWSTNAVLMGVYGSSVPLFCGTLCSAQWTQRRISQETLYWLALDLLCIFCSSMLQFEVPQQQKLMGTSPTSLQRGHTEIYKPKILQATQVKDQGSLCSWRLFRGL